MNGHGSGVALAAALVLTTPSLAGPGDGWDGGLGALATAPVTVTTQAAANAVREGGTVDVAAILTMSDGWHVNSNRPLEEWLIPTEVWLDDSTYVDVIDVAWPEAHEIDLEFSEVPMSVFEEQAVIGIRLRVRDLAAGETLRLEGGVGYQACNDQTCAAPQEEAFVFVLPVVTGSASIDALAPDLFASLGLADPGAPGGADDVDGASTDDGSSVGADTGTGHGASATPGDVVPSDEARPGVVSRVKEWLNASLASNFGNPVVAALLILVLGLMSAATPCVYPMIPITVRILMGRGGGNAALGRTHAFLYFLGIILIYAVMGFVAGATGGGFNRFMQIPVVILAFAILFALLGLSMFGLFEIQIPASVASKVDSSMSSRSGLFGTVLMGAGAGLVVSPCVGPVVVFILTQIAAQIAAAQAAGGGAVGTSGPLLYGSYLMAAYGAGLGVPFLVVGLFSARSMAKPGSWMTYVRIALGVIILYFAYDYFKKAMGTWGVDVALAKSMVLGIVLIFLAVMWGAFRTRIEDGPHAGWHKVRLATTIIMLIVGVFCLWTSLSRSGLIAGGPIATSAPHTEVAESAPGTEDSHGLVWYRDFELAMSDARASNLPVFVDFYANWCANCKVFSKQAAEEGPLRAALESVVIAKVYDTDDVYDRLSADPDFAELKRDFLPFFAILSSDGELLWKGSDYKAHDVFIRELERAKTLELEGVS